LNHFLLPKREAKVTGFGVASGHAKDVAYQYGNLNESTNFIQKPFNLKILKDKIAEIVINK